MLGLTISGPNAQWHPGHDQGQLSAAIEHEEIWKYYSALAKPMLKVLQHLIVLRVKKGEARRSYFERMMGVCRALNQRHSLG